MTRPNVARLTHLLDVLDRVPPDQFNMDLWDCDTAACAMGWACRDPEFQAEGLRLLYAIATPSFQNRFACDAAELFFAITKRQAVCLFMPSSYGDNPTPADVAARVRKVIKAARATAPAP